MASGGELEERVRQGLIERLQKRSIVELEQVRQFHEWLDDKRISRQSGHWQAVPESSNRDLFTGILEALQYQIQRGTLSEIRARVLRLLQICQVELLLIDEAHRLRSKALADLQDLLDKLQIAIILVGTDRLNAVLKRDEQVDRRFIARHQYARLSATQLAQTSAIWETHILKLPQPSHLSSAKVQKLLAPATGGYIGLLDRILREAAVRSLRFGKPCIEFKILSEVVAECR